MATEVSKATGYDTVLDVDAERLAKVYAKAFLDAATAGAQSGGAPAADAVAELKSVVSEVIGKFPDFSEALRSAFLSHEDRLAMLDRVLGGKVSGVVLNTLKVMSGHNRLEILRDVSRQAEMLLNDRDGRVHVAVSAAFELGSDLLDELAKVLNSRFGVEPVLEPIVDPDMIAGIKIRVGDTVYDGSLQTAFGKARDAMITQAIDRIENNPLNFVNEPSK